VQSSPYSSVKVIQDTAIRQRCTAPNSAILFPIRYSKRNEDHRDDMCNLDLVPVGQPIFDLPIAWAAQTYAPTLSFLIKNLTVAAERSYDSFEESYWVDECRDGRQISGWNKGDGNEFAKMSWKHFLSTFIFLAVMCVLSLLGHYLIAAVDWEANKSAKGSDEQPTKPGVLTRALSQGHALAVMAEFVGKLGHASSAAGPARSATERMDGSATSTTTQQDVMDEVKAMRAMMDGVLSVVRGTQQGTPPGLSC
jgi:hypothetical protein